MSAPDWPHIADTLADALERPPGARAAFLDEACRRPDGTADAALRHEVEAYLSASEGAVFVSPVGGLVGAVDDLAPGAEVGPWRLTDLLGEGGMGVVYRAERADGLFERAVALKRLRSGPGRRQLAARLRAERQTLARLEHPGIARLYDGGLAEDGTPYLVMELVDGEPITAWAARRDLSVEARVQLVLRVCEAAAYAHRRLVVHRDLKPSNVLVTDDGTPKLLDFGIAKLLNPDSPGGLDAADAMQTMGAAMTRAYAAPEQLTGAEITTATDVYALGVVLYELLAGRRPHDLEGKTAADVERTVTGSPPPPPSAYRRDLPHDLDTVVMKALAVEPDRRYASAEALADDLGRWLAGLPVEARPSTAGYRLGRFVRRHRAGAAAAGAVVLLVTALTALYTVRLSQERDLARTEAAKAQAVSAFLSELLTSADGRWSSRSEAAGPDVTVAEVLDAAVARLDAEPLDDPVVEGVVRRDMGNAYVGLSRFDDADRQYARSLALVESAVEPPHLEIARSLQTMGAIRYYQGRHVEADSIFARSLGQGRALDVPGRDLYMMTNNYALTRSFLGDLTAAGPLLAEAVAVGRATPEVPMRGKAVSMNNYAKLLAELGRDAEAQRIVQASLALLTPDDLEWAWAQAALARVHLEAGRYAAADSAFALAEAGFVRAGTVDAHVGHSMRVDRARLYLATGRYAAADSLARVAERGLTGQLEPEAGPFVALYAVRGWAATNQGRPADGEALLREAIRRSGASGAPRSVARVRAEVWLALTLLAQGRPADAVPHVQRAAATGRVIGLPPECRLMRRAQEAGVQIDRALRDGG